MSSEVERKRSEVERKILRMSASHSPEEISRALGGTVSPARVAALTQTLLKQKNWLSSAQEDLQISWELRDVLDQMRNGFQDLDALKAQVTVLKLIGERLERRTRATQDDLNVLYANQGRIMAQAFDLALSYMKGALRDDIDPEKWDEAQREGLYHAQAELMKHQAKELED